MNKILFCGKLNIKISDPRISIETEFARPKLKVFLEIAPLKLQIKIIAKADFFELTLLTIFKKSLNLKVT